MNQDVIKPDFLKIFHPRHLPDLQRVSTGDARFVHYTTAETAFKIFTNSELWLRNVTLMNDYSEIDYGVDLIRQWLQLEKSVAFWNILEKFHLGSKQQIIDTVESWITDWRHETYILCISEHLASEDLTGRLSMWRAYGNIALVIKSTPMAASTDRLGAYSIPVTYWRQGEFNSEMDRITTELEKFFVAGHKFSENQIPSWVHQFFFNVAIGSKHPGFHEEKEWRVYFRPNEPNDERSNAIQSDIVVIGGVPQIVWKLPLRNAPEEGLYSAHLDHLLDRVIIGPCDFPFISAQAMRKKLHSVGVSEPEKRVVISDLPLRTSGR